MSYTVRDNVDQGLGRLPTQFDQSPLLRSLLETYLQGVDDLQSDAIDYLEGIRINTAIGNQLDIIGEIVGESRLSRTDEEYRTAIKTRIVLNTSRGQPSDIYAAARAIANSDDARFWEHYPASLIVSVTGENLAGIPQNAKGIVDQSAPAGVSVDEFMIDTTLDGMVFAEVLFESGEIVTDQDDEIIDNEGDFIGYQLVTETAIGNSLFAEIDYDTLVTTQAGDTYTLNGDTWIVSDVDPDAGQTSGNAFYEALR